ncbi:unnamed protein product [Porites lobata]|uniref:Uncharacterized protein n=1 Tax=Porites lobata TaxID=104759 RepID=A0ABN8NL05_9CNID|nr:unnamed protein product [Porites lobata]
MEATAQYFPVVLIIMLYKVVLTFSLPFLLKSVQFLSIQRKQKIHLQKFNLSTSQTSAMWARFIVRPTEQYFPVVLFIMLYKVLLTFESVDVILSVNIQIKAIEVVSQGLSRPFLKTFADATKADQLTAPKSPRIYYAIKRVLPFQRLTHPLLEYPCAVRVLFYGNKLNARHEGLIPKILVDQYKITTQEIVVTAVLDITENVVLYAFPLYQMSVLKSCLKRVLEMVEDSDYGAQQNPNRIFRTRQEKKDFTNWFRNRCISGITVLGREVSFLWTLVLTFFGPFVVVVVNLMFKHIHVESPWH